MGDQWGTNAQIAPRTIGTEHGYLILAAVSGSTAALIAVLDHTTDVHFGLAGYVLLATLACVGWTGWLVRSEGARWVAMRESVERLEAAALGDDTGGRSGPRLACQHTGRRYVSASAAVPNQDLGVGIARDSVDAATDPGGVALQRARDAGVEQGFEIGYQAHLAELGVASLPKVRQRRLMSDS